MPYVIALLITLAGLGFGGWKLHSHAFDKGYQDRDLSCAVEKAEKDRKITALTQEKLAYQSSAMEAERQARAVREAGRIRADQLAEELAATRASLATTRERTARELARHASATRQCFSGSVASLLNASTGVRGPDVLVPTSPGDRAGPVAGGTANPPQAAATGPDGPGTSEQAAAGALMLARDSFASCRDQLRRVLLATKNPPIE